MKKKGGGGVSYKIVLTVKVLTEVSLEGAEEVTWSEVHWQAIPTQGTRNGYACCE